MIPIRDKKTDISTDIARGNRLKKQIEKIAEEAAQRNVGNIEDLNEVVAELSKKEKLNRAQIQRLVEETNTITYNKRYDELRDANDRRITFNLASLDDVVQEMGFAAPPEVTNPNLSSGKEGEGEGEMNKAASAIEPSYIHHPNTQLEKRWGKQLEKQTALQKRKDEKEQRRIERERKSALFKIANSLVMNERSYKTANKLYNSVLEKVALDDEALETIQKNASSISEQLTKRGHARSGFMVSLEMKPEEKIASPVLGEYSLLKQADTESTENIKMQPTVDAGNFQQLIDLARKVEKDQQAKSKQQKQQKKEVTDDEQ